MKNVLLDIISKKQKGIHSGIASFCSANKFVIEAIMEQAKNKSDYILIEATSNQVNQFGGYMNMTPKDFKTYVYKIADEMSFDKSKILLGGDHLGPQPWQDLDEEKAMEYSKELVKQYVLEGYTKIHLDTSMRLISDDPNVPLSDEKIATRGAILCEVCEKAYQDLLKKDKNAIHPVYVIGSEVPIPGGSQEDDGNMNVTSPIDVDRTILAYKEEFSKRKLNEAWNYIIAIVVQPGVEFGATNIHQYNRNEAIELCESIKKYSGLVFEGHSTDFQSPAKLREMVEDGIAILKVGPALTYALREALFGLSMIEKELIPKIDQANFIEILDDIMIKNPNNWKKHYYGQESELRVLRKYSFSDRCRYYLNEEEVIKAQKKLLDNLSDVEIPLTLLHQYMPVQYKKVRDNLLSPTPKELIKNHIINVVDDYNYAIRKD